MVTHQWYISYLMVPVRIKEKKKMKLKTLVTIIGIGMYLAGNIVPAQAAVRIKDIAYFEGARENTLMGYGLVVGLNGSGDKSQSVFTVKSIASLLSRLGIEVDKSQITPKNVAAVMVTATLPPFIRSGSRIDVTLSSLGDASSLQGGILLLAPLQGADGQVYAVAQGQVSVGGFESGSRGGSETFGTVGRIPNGALIENEVPVTLVRDGAIHLLLNGVDLTTCVRVAEAVNVSLNATIARAVDGATVAVEVPVIYKDNLIPFLASIERITLEPDARAKIIINERTGTVVGGKEVKISRVSITHKNINIDIKPPEEKEKATKKKDKKRDSVSSYLAMHEEVFMESQKEAVAIEEREFTSIGEVAELFHSMGIKPTDMIAIFQAMKEAGAIQAELMII